MNLFALSDGKIINPAAEYKENSFQVIPDNTLCIASIESIGFDEYEGDRFIDTKFVILTGEYLNRKIFHKFRIFDNDEKKRDRAKMMLLAVDTICGGTLYELASHGKEISTFDLTHLENKPMQILLRAWEFNGNRGNYIGGIQPVSNGTAPAKKITDDDDIPF